MARPFHLAGFAALGLASGCNVYNGDLLLPAEPAAGGTGGGGGSGAKPAWLVGTNECPGAVPECGPSGKGCVSARAPGVENRPLPSASSSKELPPIYGAIRRMRVGGAKDERAEQAHLLLGMMRTAVVAEDRFGRHV